MISNVLAGEMFSKIVLKTLILNQISKRKSHYREVLYGSESWALSEALISRLTKFHNFCVRSMCRVNLWITRRKRISQKTLEGRLGVESMEKYLQINQLRWAGHVSRMASNRFPKQFFFAWVDNPRRKGRPQFTYGQQLRKAGIDAEIGCS